MSNLSHNFSIKTKYGAMAVTAMPILIFGSAYVAWTYLSHRWRTKTKEREISTRSMSIGAIHGGQLALERMVQFHNAKADAASVEAAVTELKTSLDQPFPDFKTLQSTIAKLEMGGKEADAVKILKEQLEKAQKESKSHEAYEIEMLLVEMLIHKGDFIEAYSSKCLREEGVSDARRPLFEAVIHIMLEHPEENSAKCWEEFVEKREHFVSPPAMEDNKLKLIEDFSDFKKVVNVLKEDINKANKMKTKK